jgi:hypothetical protein
MEDRHAVDNENNNLYILILKNDVHLFILYVHFPWNAGRIEVMWYTKYKIHWCFTLKSPYLKFSEYLNLGYVHWLTSVATQEVNIGRIEGWGQPGHKVSETLSQPISWVWWCTLVIQTKAWDPTPKVTKAEKGSSSRLPAYQAWDSEFKPQYCKSISKTKQNKALEFVDNWILSLITVE